MASLQFSRNTKAYIEQGGYIWEVPIMDGFSFSQATNATEITLNEMADGNNNSRRDRAMFNDSVAPAEWSFSSYMRPNAGASGSAVEEALWANLVAINSFNGTAWTAGVTKTTNNVAFDFDDSNKTTLGIFDLYFVMGACGHPTGDYTTADGDVTIYKLADCVINSASISFDIDGIAMIEWSGFGRIITEETTFDTSATDGSVITTGVTSTSNFIRNRLTSLSVQAGSQTITAGAFVVGEVYTILTAGTTDFTVIGAASSTVGTTFTATGTGTGTGTATVFRTFPGASFNGVYNVTLTGGSITIENNISYLTPENLCVVNQPIGHVTGTRSISGDFTCYLTGAAGGSEDLFEDLIGATNLVRNSFALNFSIGGSSAPKVVFDMPTCHLEIPTHSIEDVVSVQTTFHALPSAVGSTDELVVTYTGAA
jgi:hypothetical protein